jgi:hypothetical protein
MLRFFDCAKKCCVCCRKNNQYDELEAERSEERRKEEEKKKEEIQRLREEEAIINEEEDVLLEEAKRIQRRLEGIQLKRFMFVHENLESLRRYTTDLVMPEREKSEASSAPKRPSSR